VSQRNFDLSPCVPSRWTARIVAAPRSSGILLLVFLRKVFPSNPVGFYHVPFPTPMARIDLATSEFASSHSPSHKYFKVRSFKLSDLLPPVPLTMDGSDDFKTSGLRKLHSPVKLQKVKSHELSSISNGCWSMHSYLTIEILSPPCAFI
jgi:hypothetical protein